MKNHLFFLLLSSFLDVYILGRITQQQPTNNVLTTQSMVISYQIIGQNLQLNIQGVNNGWIGIGYGQGMQNVDMSIISYENGQIEVNDYWGIAVGNVMKDTDQGGSNNVELVGNNSFDQTSGMWNVTIERPLAKTDGNLDSAIPLDTQTSLSLALGEQPNFLMNGHKSPTINSIMYSSNSQDNQNPIPSSPPLPNNTTSTNSTYPTNPANPTNPGYSSSTKNPPYSNMGGQNIFSQNLSLNLIILILGLILLQ